MQTRRLVFGALCALMLLVGALGMPAHARPADARTGAAPAGGDGVLDCSHGHVNRDPRSGQFFDANGVNIRTGPHTGCTSLGQGQLSHNVDYHCYVHSDYVNGVDTWTYLRDTTNGVTGWVHDSLLDYRDGYRGSNEHC